jgi:hypothetical protein
MVRKNVVQRKMSKLLGDRKGTAEIIGTVMFLVILLFVFTNVYLWHDSATREMNGVLAEKMNTRVSIAVGPSSEAGLVVTNNGGFEIGLSRIWLVTGSGSTEDHSYIDLEPFNIRVGAGGTVNVLFGDETYVQPDGDIQLNYLPDQPVTCKILTTLGNVAACTYNP